MLDFDKSILKKCEDQKDDFDQSVDIVKAGVTFAQDLHVFDAVYHQLCSINFKTGKAIPQIFTGEPRGSDQETKGREARKSC